MIPIAAPRFGKEEQDAVQAVLESGMVASGPEVAAFEAEYAAYCGARHGVATTNGTTALQVALEALGVGPGDEVVVPAFTFIATANAVLYVGAKPVFADVDPVRFTLAADDVERAITDRTKALLPVHLFGQMTDMYALQRVADDAGLAMICDAAQAHGAELEGAPVGSWGDVQTWSFYPTKNMSSIEGGMVTSDDGNLIDAARSITNQGRGDASLGQYMHIRRGSNYRLSDVHAAVGRVQLSCISAWIERRREIASHYARELTDLETIRLPIDQTQGGHAYHQFTLRCVDRSRVQDRLKSAGIGTGVYYPEPLYAYPHLAEFKRSCPVAEELAGSVLSIPVHHRLSDDDLAKVVSGVREADHA